MKLQETTRLGDGDIYCTKQAHLQRPEQATTLYTACTYYTTHTHTHTQTHAHIHTCTNSCSEGIQLRQATQGVGVCSFVRIFLLVCAKGWKIQTPQNWNEARINISVRCKFINWWLFSLLASFRFSGVYTFPSLMYTSRGNAYKLTTTPYPLTQTHTSSLSLAKNYRNIQKTNKQMVKQRIYMSVRLNKSSKVCVYKSNIRAFFEVEEKNLIYKKGEW